MSCRALANNPRLLTRSSIVSVFNSVSSLSNYEYNVSISVRPVHQRYYGVSPKKTLARAFFVTATLRDFFWVGMTIPLLGYKKKIARHKRALPSAPHRLWPAVNRRSGRYDTDRFQPVSPVASRGFDDHREITRDKKGDRTLFVRCSI
ncbi:hypothetical protein BDM02DRAFT_3115623 [Thelephora ganbajun]|uniref:Uncharacterized protein n=1 Tax=Thelephora ganbajun TaxID=370292 RepID=A0ACB6ZFF1_THEGA|nr:hypothetical protein BDM02DRAFT_3115623 [Thelephora ganbajun]